MEEVFEFAKRLQADGHFDKAEECYRRYLEDHQDSFKALNNLGIVLQSQDKLGEAVECFRKATQLVPDDPIPRFNLGNAFYSQDRFESAAGQFKTLLEKTPGHGAARINLAIIHWRDGELIAAEAQLRKALEQSDTTVKANSKLGLLLFDTGRYAEARDCHLEAANSEESAVHFFHAALCEELLGNHARAAELLARVVLLDPTSRIAHEHRVRALIAAGQNDATQAAFDEWAAALPGDPICSHMRAASVGDNTLTRCSEDFVRDTFGAFAGDYDQTLTRLGYGAPAAIEERLNKRANQEQRLPRVLDAGCGTGLCATLLRKHAKHLAGVDLAAPMLDKARTLAVYDELREADLIDYLQQTTELFDLIVAADTFNYFGALDQLLQASAAALPATGELLFTLEKNNDLTDGYRLMPHGRFQHKRAYIAKSLADAGFAGATFDTFVLRREKGQDVNGWLIQAQRT